MAERERRVEQYPFQIGLEIAGARLGVKLRQVRGRFRINGQFDIQAGVQQSSRDLHALPSEVDTNQRDTDFSFRASIGINAGFGEQQTTAELQQVTPMPSQHHLSDAELDMEKDYANNFGLPTRETQGVDWTLSPEEQALMERLNLSME